MNTAGAMSLPTFFGSGSLLDPALDTSAGFFQARQMRMVLGLLGIVLLALAGCESAPPAREPTAAEILLRSADQMAQARSFHFQLEVPNGTMVLGPNLAANSVDGDVSAPDRFKAAVKARFSTTPVEIQVVAIGAKQYVTNPLNRQWQEVSGSLVIPALLDPGRGVGTVLRRVERPERLGKESVDGLETYHLRGNIPADVLAALIGSREAASEPVIAEFWIDTKEFRLRQVKLVGAITAGESTRVERIFRLTDFDKPVAIEAPIP
jgi:hypothetical protein